MLLRTMLLWVVTVTAVFVIPIFVPLTLSVLTRAWHWRSRLLSVLAQVTGWALFGALAWTLGSGRDFALSAVAVAAGWAAGLGCVSTVILWLSTLRETVPHPASGAIERDFGGGRTNPLPAPCNSAKTNSWWASRGVGLAWTLVATSFVALIYLLVDGFVFDPNDYAADYWRVQANEHALSMTISVLISVAGVTVAGLAMASQWRSRGTAVVPATALGIGLVLGLAIIRVGAENINNARYYAGVD